MVNIEGIIEGNMVNIEGNIEMKIVFRSTIM